MYDFFLALRGSISDFFTLFEPLGAHAEVSWRGEGVSEGTKLSYMLLPFDKSFFLRICRVEKISNFSTTFQKSSTFF